MRLLGRHARALAIADAFVGLQRRRFTDHGQLGRLFAVDGPREKKIQVGALFGRLRHVFDIRQSGKRVCRREARDIIRRLHRLLNGGFGKVRGAGVAPAFAEVDRDAQ